MAVTDRRFWYAMAGIVALAFGLRVGLAAHFVGLDSPPDMEAQPDQIDYENGAYQLTQGRFMTLDDGTPTAKRTPGTALSLLPAYAAFGRSYTAGRIWFCLLSSLTCLATGLIALQLVGRRGALISAALLAIYPGHAYHAMHFVSEVPYGLWLASAAALSIAGVRRGGWKTLIGAGLCWGLAIHCRPQLVLLVPISVLVVALLYRWMQSSEWKLMARRFAVQAAVVAALIVPWLVRNQVVMGKATMSSISGLGLWGAHNALTFNNPGYRGDWARTSLLEQLTVPLPREEMAKDKEAWRRGMESIQANLGKMPLLIGTKLARFVWPFAETPNAIVRWAFALSWMAILPFIVWGALVTWKQSRDGAMIILLPTLATLATVVMFYGSIRFRDSIAPLFVAMAGIGMARCLAMIQAKVRTTTQDASVLHTMKASESEGEIRRAA
ncbi:MAG: glycosyltransferase family 39 protein [Phycisphaeraceae bacterium]